MEWIVGKKTMKAWEEEAISETGIASLLLMEQAAMGLADVLLTLTESLPKPRILFLCGSGNNGADALAAARFLNSRLPKAELLLLIVSPEKEGTKEFQLQREIDRKLGIPETVLTDEVKDRIKRDSFDLYVDGITGIGFSGELAPELEKLIEHVNRTGGLKVAVDIPTGVEADTGMVRTKAFLANETVTFGFRKIGLCLYPGRGYAGQVTVVPLTGPKFMQTEAFRKMVLENTPCTGSTDPDAPVPPVSACRCARVFSEKDLKDLLPLRYEWSNKGNYGKLLIVAGSKNMAGAAAFSARAALLAGCGLVRVLTPEENRVVLHSLIPEAVLSVYDSREEALRLLQEGGSWADAAVIGPGLGQSDTAKALVEAALSQADCPLVMDGDALNILAQDPALRELLKKRQAQTLLTPHLGEMSRLSGKPVKELQQDLYAEAGALAERYACTCLCKDAVSVLADKDWKRLINESGCNGMATAGSGDVLAGLAGAFLTVEESAYWAAGTAAFLHGMAGRMAALSKGNRSMTATDILEGIPAVLKDL